MRVENVRQVRSWTDVLNRCRRTIGRDETDNMPTDTWKAQIILAEHSPLRLIEFDWTWRRIMMWVSTHLVRHVTGTNSGDYEPFVRTQRSDRSGIKREHTKQTKLNDMDFTANAQALINMSRRRLCAEAAPETREAWKAVIAEIAKTEPILASKCVKECVYRGFCPAWTKCGYDKTDKYRIELQEYRNVNF